MSHLRPILLVFVPFAAGYYLSYLFRVINAVLAQPLVDDVGFGATQLGFLTSVYFLAFAGVQLPLGVALDRFGSRRVQGLLLMLAASGALTFALATTFPMLALGRGLIGLGVAGALIAGLKALADVFPKERLPLINGAFVAVGAAGAVTATAPAEWLLNWIDWRGLILVAAAATAAVAVLTLLVVPEPRAGSTDRRHGRPGIKTIYADPRFWRLAPLSSVCIGTAWSLQGLWAAPWLADVIALDRPQIVQHLFVMALALCAGALLLGITADALRHRGVSPQTVLAAAASTFIAAQLALVFRLPLPSLGLWAIVAAMGAATVLTYALIADLYPKEIAGRANAALNVLHISAAFVIQTAIGLVVGFWPQDVQGRYPATAYDVALVTLTALQGMALLWFLRPLPRAVKTLQIT